MTTAHLIVESKWLPATRELAAEFALLQYADRADPLVWLREDVQAVGVGEAVRLTARGPDRFQQLQTAWNNVVAAAQVTDEVQVPGSGLTAFGTVAFADESAAASLLVVPAVTLHRHHDRFFVTTARLSDSVLGADPVPVPLYFGQWQGCELEPLPGVTEANSYRFGAEKLLAAINAGEAAKVVLARQIFGSLPAEQDLRVPLSRLAREYAECATFAVDGFLGASPETLARSIGGQVTTRVLAGTAPRDHANPLADSKAGESLLTSAQITEEHEYAAQSVITALEPLVSELDTNTKPLVVPLPNVWHRATDIHALVPKKTSVLELVAAMHPTAAVAGTPTPAALQLLKTAEGFDRGRYAGAVGWINANGDGEWALALRCAQVAPPAADGSRQVVATAGGGLVATSEVQAELQETVVKFAPIAGAFAR